MEVAYILQILAATLWLIVMADGGETIGWHTWVSCVTSAVLLAIGAGWQIGRHAASVRQVTIACVVGPALVLVGLMALYGRQMSGIDGAADVIVTVVHVTVISTIAFLPLFITVALTRLLRRTW